MVTDSENERGAGLSYAKAAAKAPPQTSCDEDDTPYTVVDRRRKSRTTTVPAPKTIPSKHPPPLKAPAVLIKGRKGTSYAETVRAIKNVVNPAELGVNISKMRMNREGHLLLEVKGGDDSIKEAEVLKEAVVITLARWPSWEDGLKSKYSTWTRR